MNYQQWFILFLSLQSSNPFTYDFFCLKTTCTIIAWAKTNHLHLKNFQNRQYYLNSGHCGRNHIQTFPVQGHCHIPWQCHKSANLGIQNKYSCSSWPSQLNYPIKQHATEWQLHMLTISTVNGLNRGVTCNTVVRDKELTLMMMMMLKLLLPLPLLSPFALPQHAQLCN